MKSGRLGTFVVILPGLVCLLVMSQAFVSCLKTESPEVPDYDALTPLWEGYKRGSDYATMQDFNFCQIFVI